VLGVCGGLQLLGERLEDPAGVDGEADGLGLLPLVTTFAAEKLTRRGEYRFRALAPPWRELSGLAFSGYEIRHGETRAAGEVATALPGGLGFARGSVLGVATHGLLESPAIVEALLGAAPAGRLDAVFDRLADAVDAHLDTQTLLDLTGVA